MRLATAIRMGSLTVEHPEAKNIDACAITMALKAVGADRLFSYAELRKRWPWLMKVQAVCKCGIGLPIENSGISHCESVVYHPFDAHVFGDRSMTIEQLCDFIDSIDPTPRDSQESVETTQEVNTEKVIHAL